MDIKLRDLQNRLQWCKFYSNYWVWLGCKCDGILMLDYLVGTYLFNMQDMCQMSCLAVSLGKDGISKWA